MDFSICTAAQIRPGDLAKIMEVSRVTASQWLNGHKSPHRYLTPKVETTLDVIRLAYESGSLPVPHVVSRRERNLYIENALRPFFEAKLQHSN